MPEEFTPTRARFCGEYIQGAGAAKYLPETIRKLGGTALLITSKTSAKQMEWIAQDSPSLTRLEIFHGECTLEEVQRLTQMAREGSARVIVGAGGGKVLDTAKLVAEELSLPVVCFPTVASNDGAVSGCAVLYDDKGRQKEVRTLRRSPAAVIVDLVTICHSPPRLLASGMGDALATWFEADSCRQTGSQNTCGGLGGELALAAARRCCEIILEHGNTALEECKIHCVSDEFSQVVEAVILLSGIGFESGGVGCAHAVASGLGMLEGANGMYHGEKVAFGVLVGLHLNKADEETLQQIYGFCNSVDLPITFAGLGLDGVTEGELKRVAMRAAMPGESLRNEPNSPGRNELLQALLAADEFGRNNC